MTLLSAVRANALQLGEGPADYDALLEQVGERSFVLLGEATHGTLEFYRMRAEITRRLVAEKGFEAVAVEADWPDAYRLNRHVRGDGDRTALDAFGDFQRFPQWMWRNREVLQFIAWLREHNVGRAAGERAGFYGLDLYSLYRSAEAVIEYLQQTDPEQAQLARRRYACLDHVGDPQQYGYEAAFRLRPPCLEAVVRQLMDLRHKASEYVEGGDAAAHDEQFFAERNAAVVRNAETYYRAMFGSRINTWNLRDEHMCETLLALQAHLRAGGGRGRIVVWAHNSHLGDARATDMGRAGEWNVGQLLRMHAGHGDALLVGFTTYTGHVSAAHDWDGEAERMPVRPALEGSYEKLFHQSGLDRFYLPLTGAGDAAHVLREPLLERAIGVVYRPATERQSHYFHAALSAQFDAIFHLDETEAVEPLDESEHWVPGERHEAADTYPFGV